MVVGAVAAAASLTTAAAGATGPPGATYYVAVGASESLGVQPTAASPHGAPTDDGYANALVAIEHSRWPGLRLVHFGCPGITAEAALVGGGPCSFGTGSEVAAAVDFVRDHPGRTVLATVDLGFNDVWPCLAHNAVDAACAAAALDRVSRVLPIVLQRLRAAGGSGMQVVGLLHNDPYLTGSFRGPVGRRFSAAALSVIDRLNTILAGIYHRAGAAIANVPSAFSLGTNVPAAVAGGGTLPRDVAKNCTLTWMCARHNLHPNATGYDVIAGAIAAALPTGPSRPQ